MGAVKNGTKRVVISSYWKKFYCYQISLKKKYTDKKNITSMRMSAPRYILGSCGMLLLLMIGHTYFFHRHHPQLEARMVLPINTTEINNTNAIGSKPSTTTADIPKNDSMTDNSSPTYDGDIDFSTSDDEIQVLKITKTKNSDIGIALSMFIEMMHLAG